MRIMHLADLHLGRSILEQSLIEDQKYILNNIINNAEMQKIDVVLIAGDVYDKSIPCIEAVKLFSDFLHKLHGLGLKVFVIAGNHDSKERLAFGSELFNYNDIYIEGEFKGNLRCVELEDEYGKILIYMLPFVKPAEVRKFYPDSDINSYHEAVKCIIDNTDIDKSKRNVIMIHQFVTANGVEIERSDCENISLGGIDNIDVSIFDDFDYVAMGHVHRGQKLIRDTVRYAGSPLKYSFSEVNHKKSVPIIEFKEKGTVDMNFVSLDPIRDMRVIKGKINDLLDDSVVSLGNRDDYINAVITDDDYIMDAIGKLRMVYKNVLKLEYQNRRTESINDEYRDVSSNKKSYIELFSEFYELQNNIELDERRTEIVNDVIKNCIADEEG